jgi:signal recognition particle subunit SEC65
MSTKTNARIQTLRAKLAVAKIDLKNMKSGLKELGVKCKAEYKRARKDERVSDSDFEKRWNALEKEQNKAHDLIFKDYDALETAESNLQEGMRNLDSKVSELHSKLRFALYQEQDKQKQKREAARYCNHCNKIKPQAPTVCHCKSGKQLVL